MDEKTKEYTERAASVFMRLGIRSVTMDDIARELGVSKKTLYVHFKDKNELIRNIMLAKIEEDQLSCTKAQNQTANAIEELFDIIQLVIEHLSKINPNVFHDLQKYHSDAWEIITTHKCVFVTEMIRKNVERGILEGIYRSEIDADIISRLFVGMTDLIFDGKTFPWPEFSLTRVYSEIISFQIHGMANEKGLNILTKKMNKA
jgi:AcrR family transcriptional regulator